MLAAVDGVARLFVGKKEEKYCISQVRILLSPLLCVVIELGTGKW